jgi:hypothetical protein
MLKIENTEVIGWEAAIRGMRNPMNSWAKSDSGWDAKIPPIELRKQVDWDRWAEHYKTVEYNDEYTYDIGPNDIDLMNRLRNAGTDHRKFMRMITVYVDITAPLYWFKEFDTYKVGTVANSCSTMHKIADKEFTIDDFSHEHLDDIWRYPSNAIDEAPVINFETLTETVNNYVLGPNAVLNLTIKMLNKSRDLYIMADKMLRRTDLTESERKHVTAQKKVYWWQMIQLLPSSYNQRRTVMLNYEVLANMYKSRKDHKLDEWVKFCNEWIPSLPYSELITGGKND